MLLGATAEVRERLLVRVELLAERLAQTLKWSRLFGQFEGFDSASRRLWNTPYPAVRNSGTTSDRSLRKPGHMVARLLEQAR